ncbi:RagB/SusD family nutrient uptake outer membrane protein [Persicobacter diffluens]|uniref:Membrane protein n=1 Tax=Persicobacter diffluens TaxID=981 RepID=A0AAN4W208_9BACT|nr:membrane protein [Persicobacter diffluens]
MKKIFYIFFLTVLSLGACTQDFLQREPSDAIEDDRVFGSYVTAKAALVGAYNQLSVYSFDGLFIPIMSDIIGEDVMINSVDNWNWFVAVYQMNVLPNYTFADSPWWTSYKMIYDANRIIENAQSVPDATDAQRNQLEAEARVLRAYGHLKLVQMFAPAYKEDPSAMAILKADRIRGINEEPMPRATLQEIYDFMIEDLNIASGMFESISELEDGKSVGFFTKRSAQALLARAYLNMEDWESAKNAAVEAHEGLELMTANELLGGFMMRNRETIFTIAYTQDNNNVYLTIPSFYWPVAGYSSMRANDDFVDLFSGQDYRSNFFLRDNEIDENRHLILKYGHNMVVGNAERISIRASEMVLIEAEAEAELGNDKAAQEALHRIQMRANPSAPISTATGQALIDEILVERRKELFGEGFRWNDIKRRSLPLKRTGDHWVMIDMDINDPDYYKMTFPIPQSEMDANRNMIQNPGY